MSPEDFAPLDDGKEEERESHRDDLEAQVRELASEIEVRAVALIAERALPCIRRKMNVLKPHFSRIFKLYRTMDAGSRYYTDDPERGFATAVAEKCGVPYKTVLYRLHQGIAWANEELTKELERRLKPVALAMLAERPMDSDLKKRVKRRLEEGR